MAHDVLTVALNAAVDTTYFLPQFKAGAIHTVQTVHRVAGGKANNAARVLHQLGVDVLATGFAGGHAGAFIRADLERLGIRTDFEPIAGESRTCLVLVDQGGKALTEVREPGPVITAYEAGRFRQRLTDLVRGTRAVVLSGSLAPGLPTSYYRDLIRIARAAGAYVVLDTSGGALGQGLAGEPDLVKPNRDELSAWAGRPVQGVTDILATAQAMRQAGAAAVAVSLGGDGLLYVGPDGAWQAKPPPVAVINTVGSGDSLVAGFVAGQLAGRPLDEALRLGVACGTANALTESVASPATGDIDWIFPQIQVERFRQ